jgi:spore maturation protein CgeB
MRVLVVGDGHSELHEKAVLSALVELKHEAQEFSWHHYYISNNRIKRLFKKIQNKFIIGPMLKKINKDLLKVVNNFNPDLMFFYRGTHILPSTLVEIKKLSPKIILVGYNNDDPFAAGHPSSLWRHFLKGVPLYDLILGYRHHNLKDFTQIGAKRVGLMRSWYFPSRNHPVKLSNDDEKRYGCDVVFIGHYENDFRKQYLEEVVRSGFSLKIFGPGYEWDKILKNSPELKSQIPVNLVWGEEYNKALCGAKVGLCFLSKLNRDTYTRRCFEIPATKTMMLSEYTDDLASLFQEGHDADFFRSKDQLIEKIRLYVENEDLRKVVAGNGNKRVKNDGHDVVSRIKDLLVTVEKIAG